MIVLSNERYKIEELVGLYNKNYVDIVQQELNDYHYRFHDRYTIDILGTKNNTTTRFIQLIQNKYRYNTSFDNNEIALLVYLFIYNNQDSCYTFDDIISCINIKNINIEQLKIYIKKLKLYGIVSKSNHFRITPYGKKLYNNYRYGGVR